jgi:hypothetical protein
MRLVELFQPYAPRPVTWGVEYMLAPPIPPLLNFLFTTLTPASNINWHFYKP